MSLASVAFTTLARTLLVLRSLAPTTAVLPTVPLPALSFLPLCLFPFLAAHVGFVNLNRASKGPIAIVLPRLTDALEHEPCGLLGHADIPVKLHARHAFKAG